MNEPQRILMLSTYFPPQYSGAALQAVALAKKLKKKGVKIEFVTVQWTGLAGEDFYEGFKVTRLPKGTGRHAEFIFWAHLFWFCLKNRKRFTIFHSHGAYYMNCFAGVISRFLGWSCIVKATMAANDLKYDKTSAAGMAHHLMLKTINAYIAISRDLYREFIEKGMRRQAVHMIPNGVDTERFSPIDTSRKLQIRKQYGIPDDKAIALFVGVLDRRKNIQWLMEFWLRHKDKLDKVALIVVGPRAREDRNGALHDKLEALAQKDPERLKLLGKIEAVEKMFQASDLFILPSLNEGLPNVLLEAMATGLPCLAVNSSGSNDIILDGYNGRIFDMDQETAFLDYIFEVIKKKEHFKKNAIKYIADNFSLDHIAGRYHHLYKTLTDSENQP